MTFQIYAKRHKLITKRCPYCNGLLQPTSHYIWNYDCLTCDRAWKVFGNIWTALFSADKMIVDKKEEKK